MDIEKLIKNNTLQVKVKANARTSQIIKIQRGEVHIDIAAPPQDGKANKELEKFLQKELNRKAKVIRGSTRSRKLLLFE